MAKKILIIDDDPIIVKYLERLFQNSGYETVSASSSMEGFDLLHEQKPDLITLDLQMEEEWGTRFYRRLQKEPTLKEIPIIVISGLAGRHAVRGAAAFFSKPFDPEKLLGTVKKTIG